MTGPSFLDPRRLGDGNGLRVFRHRNYRLFFIGQAVSLVGTWMQQVAQAWLVLQLTHDPIWLGIVAAAQFIPVMIFGLFAGVLADALPKRRVLIWTQVSDDDPRRHPRRPGLRQRRRGLDDPRARDPARRRERGRHARPPGVRVEMVGREDVGSAVALNSAMFNGARVVGPAVAGLAIGAFGVALAFGINAASFLAAIVGLALMDERTLRIGKRIERPDSVRAVVGNLARGPALRPPDAGRPARRRRRGSRCDGRHELRRDHPGVRRRTSSTAMQPATAS